MEDHASTAVAITTIVSLTVFVTKLLDLASAWLKYKTELVRASAAPAPSTATRSPSSFLMILTLLLKIWPAVLCYLSFLSILFWYAWWQRPVTTAAIVNIALAAIGLFTSSVFVVFFVAVGFLMKVKDGRDG